FIGDNLDDYVLFFDGQDLHLSGDFTTYNQGNKAIHMTNNAIRFHNWLAAGENNAIGSIYGARREVSESEPGLAIRHEQNSRLSLLYIRNENTGVYIDFDKNDVLGNSSNYPIYVHQPTLFSDDIYISRGINLDGHNRIYGGKGERANQMILRVPTAPGTGLRLMDTVGNVLHVYDPGASNRFYWNRSARFSNNLIVRGNLSVDGSKNAVHKTKNYDRVAINAYETAEYFNGDLGSGKLDDSGICYVSIDDVFSETINTDVQYHVFLQKLGQGDIWIKERNHRYFVVEGTPGLKFSWELKAKRDGYEYDRLESPVDLENLIE